MHVPPAPVRRTCFAVSLSFSLLAITATSVVAQSPAMIRFQHGGQTRQGLLLLKSAKDAFVLARDGWLHEIPHASTVVTADSGGSFEPLSAVQLRQRLRQEYGRGYEVLSTQNFLVIQPAGRGDYWPKLFEDSYRGFKQYVGRRGVDLRSGSFPMVAIVMPDESAMYRELKRHDIDVRRVAGIYDPHSNRIITHDGDRRDFTRATVRHEAAHQSAFNLGVHSRINDTPRWITEGLGQMFEPAAMTDARVGTTVALRINQDSLKRIRQKWNDFGRLSEAMQRLVADDTMFDSPRDVDDAYALSWSMLFFLAERDPSRFAKILTHTSKRPPFQTYTRVERQKDFARIVSDSTPKFAREVRRFLDRY